MTTPPVHAPFATPADAERGFYEAFANLDLDRMMNVWSASDDVVCTHPGAAPLHGPSSIAQGWKQIFGGAQRGVEMNIRVARRWQTETLACHVVIETMKGDNSGGSISATNIYRLENDSWHMISHHGGPMPAGQVIKGRVSTKNPTVH